MTAADLRALDAECARWMGCTIRQMRHDATLWEMEAVGPKEWHAEGDHWVGPLGDAGNRYYRYVPVPYFTTDIKAAWTLLEKLVADGAYVEIWSLKGKWRVRTDATPDGSYAVFMEDTAPLAIVRMALSVQGGGR